MMSRWYHRLSPWVHTTPPGRSARCMASKKGCRGGGQVCVWGGGRACEAGGGAETACRGGTSAAGGAVGTACPPTHREPRPWGSHVRSCFTRLLTFSNSTSAGPTGSEESTMMTS